MVSIKRALMPLLGMLLLAACSTAPVEPEPIALERDEQFQPSALPQGPLTANPYEANSASVPEPAQRQFRQALHALESQRWDEAQAQLEAMTEQYPQLSGPWVNLARLHAGQAQPERAVAALERALALNPDNLDAYNHLALLKREAGEFDRAEQLYREALEVWPFHAPSHRNLGILLDLYRGEGEQALLHYRAYQQLQEEPEREVTGWIMDLERRLGAQARGSGNE